MASIIPLGIKEDIQTFIRTYLSQSSSGYSTFAVIWKRMRFDSIFSGRRSVSELKFLTNAIFSVLKFHACKTLNKEQRTCGVFLLYGIYYLQPLVERVKIRIELEEWEDLLFFVTSMREECIDVVFCFSRLWRNCAFDFVLSSVIFNVENLREQIPRYLKPNDIVKDPELLCMESEKVSEECNLDEDFLETQDEYNSLKSELAQACKTDLKLYDAVNLECRTFDLEPQFDSKQESCEAENSKNPRMNRSFKFLRDVDTVWRGESIQNEGETFPVETMNFEVGQNSSPGHNPTLSDPLG